MLIKQPYEAMTATVAFAAPALASIASVTVQPRGLVPAVAALVVAAQAVSAEGAAITLTGGTDGERYLITVRGLDAGAAAREAEIELAVLDLAWAAPDGTTPYLSIAQFVDRLGIDEAVRLTEASAPGRIDKARLIAAITDAQSIVDGYLATRYSVPLAPAPALITTLVYDMTVAKLWRGEQPADIQAARAAALATLRDLAKGVMALPESAALVPAAASPTPVLTEASGRLFTRTSMAGL